MNNQKMLDVVTMIANIILPDKCDHESALETWLRAMKRKARDALESHEREPMTNGHAIGNAAAMREALGATIRFLDNLEYEEIEPYSPLDEDAPELRKKIRDALSAPARNCDVVPVEAPEAADVFHSERPGHGYDYETHDWLLAPAAELKKEGKGDGAR